MSLRARTSVLDEWVKEKGSEKEWFWWSEILMGIPGGEAFGFVVVALCLLADQTVIQAVWSLVVWGRLVPRLCSCELWTCTLSHLRDQWDTPLAAAAVLVVVHCRSHVPFQSVFNNQRAVWRGAVCKDSTPDKLVSELVEVLQVRGVRSQPEDKELASSNSEGTTNESASACSKDH